MCEIMSASSPVNEGFTFETKGRNGGASLILHAPVS